MPGTSSCPSSRYRSIVAAAGATPCAQSTSGSPRSADQKTTGRSPPGPLRCGSTTWSVNPAATAASNALPPRSSTAMPAAVPSQWVEATIPNVPRSSGLVVNGHAGSLARSRSWATRCARCTRWQATLWPARDLLERRLHLDRLRRGLRRERAAGAEAAPGRRREGARHVALEHDPRPRPLADRVGDDRRREQRLRVRVQRRREQLVGRGLLDDLAEVHDRDAVAEELDGREVVRDEEAGEAEVALEVAQQVEDRRLHRDVERRDGLVGDQQRRLHGEGAREADALALPAGELVRVAMPELGPQADLLEERDDPLVERASPGDPVQPERLADDRSGRHPRVERRVRILEDHVHLAAQRPHLAAREVGDVGAEDADRPGGRLHEPRDAVADRGLAAAGLADQADQLARADRQRHAVDRSARSRRRP